MDLDTHSVRSLTELQHGPIPAAFLRGPSRATEEATYRELLSALALALEAQANALVLARELLRREGRHWGEVSHARNEPIGSLVESCLGFRDWVSMQIGSQAEQVKVSVDSIVRSAVEAYFATAMQSGREAAMSDSGAAGAPFAPGTSSNLEEPTADRVLSELEGRILREVERYGRMLRSTGTGGDASSALQSLVRKELITVHVGAGIELQLTEKGRFLANMGREAQPPA